MLEIRPGYEVYFLLTEFLPVGTSLRSILASGTPLYQADAADLKPDVFFLTDCFVPLDRFELTSSLIPPSSARSAPSQFSIFYDAIPTIFRGQYLGAKRDATRYARATEILRQCEGIFAISDTSRCDAVRYLGIRPDRIETIFGGIGDVLRDFNAPLTVSACPVGSASRLELKAGQFFLCVSGSDWRKNLETLIDAYALYRRSPGSLPWPLVITGSVDHRINSILTRVISWSGLVSGKDIIVTGVINSDELNRLQSAAAATVIPSIYEGLGLPALESYAAGRPVLGSNSSSLRELVAPCCQFDPTRARAIAAKLTEFATRPRLAGDSLAFGSQVLKRHHWARAAQAVVARLDRVPNRWSRPIPSKSPEIELAVYTSLPPARSGVADATWSTFREWPGSLHLFGSFPAFSDLLLLQAELDRSGSSQRRVFPLRAARGIGRHVQYHASLFVFGNSHHHVPASFELAEVTRRVFPTLVQLHESQLTGFWHEYLGHLTALKSLYCTFYPEKRETIFRSQTYSEIAETGILGLRPFCNIFRVSDLILNSPYARELVERDLAGWANPRLHTMFLPMRSQCSPPPAHQVTNQVLTVGHFGIPGPLKGCKVLIKACEIVGLTRPVKLIFAGHYARTFVEEMCDRVPPFIEIIDSPDAEAFHSAMDLVDLAVQLRFNPHGESSGAVHALLERGKQVIVSGWANYLDYGEAVIQAPVKITPETLAGLILANIGQNRSPQICRVVEQHSVEKFHRRLREIIASARSGSQPQSHPRMKMAACGDV